MAGKTRIIEIFSAGCSVCEGLVARLKQAACPSCDVRVLDMNTPDTRRRAAELGIGSVPAVAIDGKLADCRAGRSVDLAVLRAAGLGQSIA